MSYLDELEQELGLENQPNSTEPKPPEFDPTEFQTRLEALENQNKELTERNRKLTQLALNEPVSEMDYNAQIKQAMDTNPLAYTKEVVTAAKQEAMQEFKQQLETQSEQQSVAMAINNLKQQYPALVNDPLEAAKFGAVADYVHTQIQQGQIKDIKPNEYDKILNKAVSLYRQNSNPSNSNWVMSLDVGNQTQAAYGTNDLLQQLNSIPDTPEGHQAFLNKMNAIQSGAQFSF
jgi:alanyl-tRNA synthetase